jgi:hypothetical protein
VSRRVVPARDEFEDRECREEPLQGDEDAEILPPRRGRARPARGRADRTNERQQTGLEAFDDGERESPGVLRGPVVLAGALVAAIVIGGYLYFSDSNSDRWELRCTHGRVEARRGVYFPWGTRRIADDAHAPLVLPEGVSCASAAMGSVQEMDRVLAGLLLEAAEHQLQQGGPEALADARRHVERARRLQGLSREQRQQIEALVTDMSYHEAREILRQVERSLWQARRKLEHARATGAGERISDLDEWLRFVETETERFRPGDDEPPAQAPSQPPPAAPAPTPPRPPEPDDVFL